ncbi:ICMT-domain-containing protein [Mycena galericulata]|nr:ICMT-domain-containing protein [Mycena galericulata]
MSTPIPNSEEPFPRHPLQPPPPPNYTGRIPNTPLFVSLIAFLLGGVFALGALTFVVNGFTGVWWATAQLGFFAAAWAAFHWGEFAVTAGWNFEKCSVDSFLLENGVTYHIAHGTAVAEYLLTLYFKPTLKAYPFVSLFGVVVVVLGQALRSGAMIQAATNFSHAVAFRKRDSHVLVTDGVYAWFRHPSYAGFFYWALGTQLVLQNPVSFVLYALVMWRFFYRRTRGARFPIPASEWTFKSSVAEEGALIKFFGDQYVQYRKRVGTKIPFIP